MLFRSGLCKSRFVINKPSITHMGYNHRQITIGHVNGYPTMYYLGNPRHTQSMILTSISGNAIEKLHCGNVVNMVTDFYEIHWLYDNRVKNSSSVRSVMIIANQ